MPLRPKQQSAYISLSALTKTQRRRLEEDGKRWERKFKSRKTAIRQSGRITRADLDIQVTLG